MSNFKEDFMIQKKIKYILLTCFLLVFLVACQNKEKDTSEKTEKTEKNSQEEALDIYLYETYNVDKYLNEAIAKFESENPGKKVNLIPVSSMPEVKENDSTKTALSDPNVKEKTDYISHVNTELMTGGGPDILAMDVLPYYKYAQSGLIEDLGEYMKNDDSFKSEEYFTNILDATKYDGKQFMFPIEFSFEYIVYNTKVMDTKSQEKMNKNVYTFDDLVSIGAPNLQNDRTKKFKLFALLSGSGFGTSMDSYTFLFPWLLDMNYNTFVNSVDKKANFNDGQFASLLEMVKEYTDMGFIFPINEQNQFMGATAPNSAFRLLNDTLFYQSLYPEIPKYGSWSSSVGFPSTDERVAGVLGNKNGKVSFSHLDQSYAINSNSKNKELAWKFLKFLASEKMQSSRNLITQPINSKALENQSVYTVTGFTFDELANHEISTENKATYNDYIEKQKKYISEINTYTKRDATIDYLIQTEVASFFDGSKSATQVASELQSKVQMYLNE